VFTSLKEVTADYLKAAVWAAAVFAAAVPALFFLTLTAFIWAERNYGTFIAAASLAAFFVFVTLAIALTAIAIRRRAVRRQAVSDNKAKWWADPAVVATGIELMRMLGLRRVVPALAVGAIIFGVLQNNAGAHAKQKSPHVS
jgi:hypothetical protein